MAVSITGMSTKLALVTQDPHDEAPVPSKAKQKQLFDQRTKTREQMLELINSETMDVAKYRKLALADYVLTLELEGTGSAQKLMVGQAQAVAFVTGKAGHFSEGESTTDWAAKLRAIEGFQMPQEPARPVEPVAKPEPKPRAPRPPPQPRPQRAPTGGTKLRPLPEWWSNLTPEIAWALLESARSTQTSYADLTEDQKHAYIMLFVLQREELRRVFSEPTPGAVSVTACHIKKALNQ